MAAEWPLSGGRVIGWPRLASRAGRRRPRPSGGGGGVGAPRAERPQCGPKRPRSAHTGHVRARRVAASESVSESLPFPAAAVSKLLEAGRKFKIRNGQLSIATGVDRDREGRYLK